MRLHQLLCRADLAVIVAAPFGAKGLLRFAGNPGELGVEVLGLGGGEILIPVECGGRHLRRDVALMHRRLEVGQDRLVGVGDLEAVAERARILSCILRDAVGLAIGHDLF